MNLNDGAPIDTLASLEDNHYGGASPPPRKKLKRTQQGESCSSGGGNLPGKYTLYFKTHFLLLNKFERPVISPIISGFTGKLGQTLT